MTARTSTTTSTSTTATGAASTSVAGFPTLVALPASPTTAKAPIVFLHGAFADEHGFARWVARAAAAGHPAYAPARRGRHGVGPDRTAGLTFDDYVADTEAVLDEVANRHPDAGPPVLVGHSLGGLIAQRLAEQGRAAAIALLASAPPAMLTAQTVALRHFAPNLPRIMTGKPFVVPNDACSILALNRVPDGERAAIHAHLTEESGKVYRALMFGTVRIDAERVRVPVLVIGGEDDRIVSVRLLRKTARHYGTDAHVLPAHAHWLLEEPGWERIADAVLAWIERPGTPPPSLGA